MFSLLPSINVPTRIQGNSETLLDNIFTNTIEQVTDCRVILDDTSDHLPIFISYKESVKRAVQQVMYSRLTKETNIESLRTELCRVDWTGVMSSNDPNDSYLIFINIFTAIYDRTCPKVRVNLHSAKIRNPWMTTTLKNACIKKQQLYYKFLKTKTKNDNDGYTRYKNKLTSILRKAKQMYYHDLFRINQNNSKATWQTLNTLINKKSNRHSLPNSIMIENNDICCKKRMAESFNNYFSTVGDNLSRNMEHDNTPVNHYLKNKNLNSMFLTPLTADEVQRTIRLSKSKRSKDNLGLSMFLLKSVSDLIAKPLTHVFNLCFVHGVFPEDLKIARVIPLFKKGEPQIVSNYRPISLLPQI